MAVGSREVESIRVSFVKSSSSRRRLSRASVSVNHRCSHKRSSAINQDVKEGLCVRNAHAVLGGSFNAAKSWIFICGTGRPQ